MKKYTDDDVTEAFEDLLSYARDLLIMSQWKKDELGQYSPDYLQLELSIENAEKIQIWLIEKANEEAFKKNGQD